MKKLSVLFVLLCLPTFAFGDGCSLSFRGGYKAKRVVIAFWTHGGAFFIGAGGDPVPVNGAFRYDDKNVSLDKLESVNGKHISVPNFLPGNAVFFNCDKWQNGEYFAYSCGIGFQAVNKVGVYYDRDYTGAGGIDVYDECIKEKAQTSDKNGGVAAATTKSGSVMKNDPNATGILDCVGGSGDWEKENGHCSSHNPHSTKAICKKFVADAYYNKYKDNTGMTGRVGKLPELIDGKYMLRCVATECEDEYELARDKNGNSQGWCRKKSADKNEKTDTDENSGGDQGDTAKSNDGESGAATSTTESGDDNNVTESGSAEETKEIKKSDNVFAEIDVDLIKYFSKSSVWKKEDGSFNTARLASDSIAGVVLGTTGGIITSNVIKKNQIKKGFEDLKCTIGGQSVAAYGDEFSVGVK